ncbi:hypothetical protein G9A89_019363 [Geosiphon pyriformis]|nr:hypothetical protein G9A89_019363 [Geosiphon pyriformis]
MSGKCVFSIENLFRNSLGIFGINAARNIKEYLVHEPLLLDNCPYQLGEKLRVVVFIGKFEVLALQYKDNLDICPAGGIHDLEKQWKCSNYLSACLCCPCYLFKELFCGWCSRNPSNDGFDGIGCRPTGAEICSKCGQTAKQIQTQEAFQRFQQYPGTGNCQPQIPTQTYNGTPQMIINSTQVALPPPPLLLPNNNHKNRRS